ncbi:type II secretion system major pseudopilin GspG [Pseudomonas sp. ADAK18]|uniref:type II secretion system major pseudopilin GspG n=1 Tax=Pseudomonas sp. ADAK18 TaxID=2730848 RepID=UPI00146330A3|nr:type II secretion system major pseudopilin GspG [Pseudomonas sp. ADAK18]QJI29360.1 type II secretion system major pseudopilin GspG [Pseudomonas sp. ADAK18]
MPGKTEPTGSRMSSGGVTRWDFLVMVLVIGVLAGVAWPRIFGDVSQSEIATAKVQLNVLGKAVERFHQDMGRYPTDEQGLAVLTTQPAGEPKWKGPYVNEDILTDPWGVPYQYHYPATQAKTGFDLFSFGKDRTLGGVGDNVDIAFGE